MARPSKTPERSAFGRTMVARLAYLGKSYSDVARETDGVLYEKLLSRIATGQKDVLTLYRKHYLALMQVLEYSEEEMAAATGSQIAQPEMPSETISVSTFRIPVVTAGAGLPVWNGEDGEWISIDLPDLRVFNRTDLFVVRVVGDSMWPTLLPGDMPIFARTERLEHGRIVAVSDGDGLLVKRFLKENGSMWLASDNAQYTPTRMRSDQRVFGVYKALVRLAK